MKSILAVVDGSVRASGCVSKALFLAGHFDAKIEIVLCDSERVYALRHAYDQTDCEKSRQDYLETGRQYLEALRASAGAAGIEISTDVVCESPLYEAVVHKILKTRPDLVIKNAGTRASRGCTFDSNDWQLMRTCPVTLMMTRGRIWHSRPQFAAMVDVSSQETPGLAQEILRASEHLALGCHGDLDVVYSEREEAAAGRGKRASALNELAGELQIHRDRVHLLSGDPEQTLPEFATGRYDVLVLGALTHREGVSPAVGSLTGKLVDVLDCDFVLVKSGTYRCPIEHPDAAQVAARGNGGPQRRTEIISAARRAVVGDGITWPGCTLWQFPFGD